MERFFPVRTLQHSGELGYGRNKSCPLAASATPEYSRFQFLSVTITSSELTFFYSCLRKSKRTLFRVVPPPNPIAEPVISKVALDL